MWQITKVLKMNEIRIDDRKHSLRILRLMKGGTYSFKKKYQNILLKAHWNIYYVLGPPWRICKYITL